jgi:hypothetical protein
MIFPVLHRIYKVVVITIDICCLGFFLLKAEVSVFSVDVFALANSCILIISTKSVTKLSSGVVVSGH